MNQINLKDYFIATKSHRYLKMVPSKEMAKPNSEKKEAKDGEEEEIGEEDDLGMVIDEGEVDEEEGEEEGEEDLEEDGEEVTGEMVVQGEEGLYQVERILAKRMKNGNVEYLIKWDGKCIYGVELWEGLFGGTGADEMVGGVLLFNLAFE